MNKDNQNNNNNNLKESLQNPRTRAYIFFGVYFIFFIILFFVISNNNKNADYTDKDESTISVDYKFDKINNNNYHYIYNINENDNITVYEGDRFNTKEQFKVTSENNTKEYFNNDNIFLTKNNTWELAQSPYKQAKFLDAKEINRLLKNSTLVSKTEYKNSEVAYQYEISTTTLVSLLLDKDIDIADEVNKISVKVKDEEVYQITLDLTPYFKYENVTNNKLEISLEYSLFGEIKEIEVPKY